jgi:photosystem II stability/assembly factor-like uncharacterized protein
MIDGAGRTAIFSAAVVRFGIKPVQFLVVLGWLAIVPFVYPVENSEPAPLAARALLLDAVNTGDKIVAVGDHGNVVISRDNGLTWTQSITPTHTLLTAVSFPDAEHGWAVGHDGVILASADGGKTWLRQDDGKSLETVFLDVRFLNATRGYAVGAYGKFITTVDGGKTWITAKIADEEVHYNRLSVGADSALYLAGESGTLQISRDGGKKWRKSDVPYDGSLFGVLPLDRGELIAYGLRGHVFRSDDHGATWEPLSNEVKILITSGIRLKSGPIVLGGQSGNLFVSRDGGHTFDPWKPAELDTSIAGLVETNDGAILTVGEAGAVRIKLSGDHP